MQEVRVRAGAREAPTTALNMPDTRLIWDTKATTIIRIMGREPRK